jgi:hypothetical protein
MVVMQWMAGCQQQHSGNCHEWWRQQRGHWQCNEGGKQATAMGTKRAMAMAMRVVGNKKGNGNGGKSNGNGVKGGGQLTATRAMATRVAAEQWQ